ncbi:MAG: hypothetical protein GY756_12995 [bacterium]|nr:hypothetical protein [bacterium]
MLAPADLLLIWGDIQKLGLINSYFKYDWDIIKKAYCNTHDFVANSSMHIGKVINLTAEKSLPNLNIDPDHSLATFKMYSIDADGDIILGKVNSERLRKLEKMNSDLKSEYVSLFNGCNELWNERLLQQHKIDELNRENVRKYIAKIDGVGGQVSKYFKTPPDIRKYETSRFS